MLYTYILRQDIVVTQFKWYSNHLLAFLHPVARPRTFLNPRPRSRWTYATGSKVNARGRVTSRTPAQHAVAAWFWSLLRCRGWLVAPFTRFTQVLIRRAISVCEAMQPPGEWPECNAAYPHSMFRRRPTKPWSTCGNLGTGAVI